MNRAALVALAVVASPLAVGCGGDPSCDDIATLQHRLDGMSPDDPDWNTVNEDLDRAEADCNT